jgi:quaternary ammonium compound-resistance protein SugE
MQMAYLIAAALCFAAGGLFMKFSAGATRFAPSVGFLCLFGLGSFLQARAMAKAEMGIVYVAVLGLEAVAACALSVLVLQEAFSWPRVAAIGIILFGVVLLQRL